MQLNQEIIMEGQKFLNAIQQKVAYESLQPKFLGYNNEIDELQDLRTFSAKLDLSRFATEQKETFYDELDKATGELEDVLSSNRKTWGTARTGINMFLQNALYNRYLSESYDLYLAEHLYELPITKKAVDGLRRYEKQPHLPEWTGLDLMKPDISEQYQSFASDLADNMGVSRVHLLMFLWPGWDT
ncbi:MAG TPA: hypothetical protein VJ964_06010 [Balneolaceae bacterium]|nr:hypothetical protein [Balneolaceae bacterium]